MSEPKFSKEPWATWSNHHEMADTGDFYDEIGVKSEFNGLQICICCDCDDDDEIKANASLIAAAPEMYELLLDIVTDYQCMPNPAVMADKIEAVLKKARGEK